MKIKDFIPGFLVALFLMVAADYVAVKRMKDKTQQNVACANVLSAAKEYHSIYFMAPGIIVACLEVRVP